MSDRARTAMAFLLIIGILLIWSLLNRAKKPQEPTESMARDSVEDIVEVPEVSGVELVETYIDSMEGDTIVIDKKEIRVVLSNIGGSVKSFYLKKHDIDIVPQGRYLFVSRLRDAPETVIDFDYLVSDDSVIFTHEIADKNITKVYNFNHDFGFRLTTHFPEKTRQVLSLKSGLNITEVKNRGEDLRHFKVYIADEKVNNITKKIKDTFEYSGTLDWLALRSKYFLLTINNLAKIDNLKFYKIPKETDNVGKELSKKVHNDIKDEINVAVFGCPYYMRGGGNRYGAEIMGSERLDVSVLLLPIKYSELIKYEKSYQDIASGGIWGPISRFILGIFNFFYSIFKNYGFAIIIFGILIKTIFFPLSKQMIVSQHKMQMVQPELKKIQKKYKDSPQRLNQEMMQLYKTYKINPLSGCLPLLIQMPIFFALYQTLIISIEFRRAPFIFWITDLSLKDPYYVLPIGMGIMMLIQSLKTTVDPRQKFMVMFMPVFLVFIFLNLPSGLQLYWFTYNILTLVEHYITKRGGIK